jgi:multidrug efflux pump subunit AcrB
MIAGSDTNAALDEVESRVNALDTLPEETDRPVVSKFVMMDPVLRIAVTGDLDEASLKLLGDQVRDEVASISGISQVDVSFVRPYEISIEVSEAALRRHGMTFDQVANAVRRGSLDIPGGSVKAAGGEILLRTKGQAYTGFDFEKIIVLTRTDGTSVALTDVARIRDEFQDGDLLARFDGDPAALVTVQRIGDEDILDIAEKTYAYLEKKREEVPAGVRLVAFGDEAQSLVVRLSTLTRSAASGLLLVLVTLGLFLRFRLAMWVSAGVPIAFLGAFAAFPVLGLTISTLSVMAFILVLGIVVDDAIVIGEAVYGHERRGVDQVNAAIRGTLDVYVPVIFGVLTTVAAFIPLITVPGPMGDFFGYLGFTAILCLGFSLLESQWILPAHLAHRRIESKGEGPNRGVAVWQRFQGALSGGLERFAKERYGGFLKLSLEWRYATFAVALGVLLLSAALFGSGRLRYQFFPAVEGNTVFATLTMPRGIPVTATETAIRDIEAAAEVLRQELDEGREGPSVIRQVFTTIGKQQARDGPPDMGVTVGGSHLAEVSIELVPHSERDVGSYDVAKRWRALTGSIPDAVEMAFSAEAFSTGQPINIELRGGTVELLTQAASAVKAELVGYKGVFDVADSYRAGKQEVQLDLKPEARPLGITLDDLGRQVRQAFYGEEVQRIQRGRDDVRVMLRFPEDERSSLGFLEEMRIRTREGIEVPFGAVADVKLGRGYSTIRRTDRDRVVNVTGEVDRSVTTPEAVLADVEKGLPATLAAFPGISYSLEGEQAEHGKAMTGLLRGTAIALILIYALLAVPLGSYTQPLIIMSVIPFGTVGALVGHWIMGWDVVFFSILGIVALSGVVVNGSLVLVHFVNRARAEGASVEEAVRQAGILRFRPIFLTSATTFLGLVPLMFEGNIQARPMIPMAISLAYGVLFAAFVTLLLVPSLYLILEDLRVLRRKTRVTREPEAVAVAGGR